MVTGPTGQGQRVAAHRRRGQSARSPGPWWRREDRCTRPPAPPDPRRWAARVRARSPRVARSVHVAGPRTGADLEPLQVARADRGPRGGAEVPGPAEAGAAPWAGHGLESLLPCGPALDRAHQAPRSAGALRTAPGGRNPGLVSRRPRGGRAGSAAPGGGRAPRAPPRVDGLRPGWRCVRPPGGARGSGARPGPPPPGPPSAARAPACCLGERARRAAQGRPMGIISVRGGASGCARRRLPGPG